MADLPTATDPARPIAWRIIHFPLVLILLAMVTVAGASALSGVLVYYIPGDPNGPAAILRGAVPAAVFMGVYWAFCHWIEHRPAHELALRGAGAELGVGLLIGAALFALVVAIIWLGGGYHVIGTNPLRVLYPIIGIAILSGVTEEIVMRGLFFRIVEQALGSWTALVLSAALFGALHLGNPNATLLAGAAIALEAGVMLAALFMVTRRLWAVIGLHAAWNFTQGGVFGIAVSGNSVDGLLRPRIAGPDWLTGGDFGAEASLPAVVVCTLFGAATLVLAYRRGQVIAPFWRRH